MKCSAPSIPILPSHDLRVTDWLSRHQSYPLHAVLQKTKKLFYRTTVGMVGFEVHNGCVVLAGDPVAHDLSSRLLTLQQFARWANDREMPVCGYYFSKEMAEEFDFTFVQAGVARLCHLDQFSLKGRKAREVRRALNAARRFGLSVEELSQSQKEIYLEDLVQFESEWLKSRSPLKVKFVLSRLVNDKYQPQRWFVARNQYGQLNSFASVARYSSGEYYLDHMIQGANGHSLALDVVLSHILLKLKEERAKVLSFGFCPFQGLSGRNFLEKSLKCLRHASWFYNSNGIYAYKKKFTDSEVPRYLMLDPKFSYVKQLKAVFKATYPDLMSI